MHGQQTTTINLFSFDFSLRYISFASTAVSTTEKPKKIVSYEFF